jgi:hypothetical protein
VRITVKSDHGIVRFRDDQATVGETSLDDMFELIGGLLLSLSGLKNGDNVTLPFGFVGAEVAPSDDSET